MLLFQGDNESGTTAATVEYMTFTVFFFGGLLVKVVTPLTAHSKLSVTVPSQSKKTYDQKCREKEEADQNVNRNANTNNTRQIEKVRIGKTNAAFHMSGDSPSQYLI